MPRFLVVDPESPETRRGVYEASGEYRARALAMQDWGDMLLESWVEPLPCGPPIPRMIQSIGLDGTRYMLKEWSNEINFGEDIDKIVDAAATFLRLEVEPAPHEPRTNRTSERTRRELARAAEARRRRYLRRGLLA